GLRRSHRQELALRESYGRRIVGCDHVDSHSRLGLDDLRAMIGRTAGALPPAGRWYPESRQSLRETLRERGDPYLTYAEYEKLAVGHGLTPTSARSLARTATALGHWIYYADAPGLSDLI